MNDRNRLQQSLKKGDTGKEHRLTAFAGMLESAGPDIEISIASIDPNPDQPRTYFDPVELEELTNSIREKGVIEPLIVSPKPDGRYNLVAGERRLRASTMAGLEKVPVRIKELDDQDIFTFSMIENVQRGDLRTIELARGCLKMSKEYGFSEREIERQTGISKSNVNRYLNLFSKLDDKSIRALIDAPAEIGIAKIASLYDLPQEKRLEAIQLFIEGKSLASMARDEKPKIINVTTKVRAFKKKILEIDLATAKTGKMTVGEIDELINALNGLKEKIDGSRVT